jgi:hypothetical protein
MLKEAFFVICDAKILCFSQFLPILFTTFRNFRRLLRRRRCRRPHNNAIIYVETRGDAIRLIDDTHLPGLLNY